MLRFKFIVLLLTSAVFSSCSATKLNTSKMKDYPVSYELSMPEPSSHYFEVKITATVPENVGFLDFKMPVWTPGSYLIREYAKNVEGFEAFQAGGKIESYKISKNTWRVKTTGNEKVEVKYKVYSYELSVRNAHLDDTHGYANGAAVFMFVPQYINSATSLKIIPHESFKKVSVALPAIGKNTFEVENFDLLVDSPIEIGNQDILEFEAMGVKHTIANYSVQDLGYDPKTLINDYKKVVEASGSVFGGAHPCKEYLFIVHHMPGIGGGLEHLNSTTCQTSPDAYTDKEKYVGFLGLIAHEYFHLWNVKRLRPVALGPFDYENENYTNMLWVSEGFTSYYQDDILRRADMIEENKFLGMLASDIGNTENAPGNKVQSVAESSFDAWIKYYRPNENSNNSTVSYYTKGGIIGTMLNLMIIGNTNGDKSLDDVLRLLYNENYLAKNVGFTDDEFRIACERVSGLDLKEFFKNQIYGTEAIDYKKFYKMADIDASVEQLNLDKPFLGAQVRGKIISRVDKGTAAYSNGLNVNDEILKVNGKTFTTLTELLENKKVDDVLDFEVKRGGITRKFSVKLEGNPNYSVKLTPIRTDDPISIKKYKKFMHIK
ncbi:MAG: PDZ domain-containing protein [Spirosomataceae bacterium]